MSTIINATTTNGVVIQPDNSGSLVLQTNNGTTALTIDTSQNVGIGTTSPSVKLEIAGGVSAQQVAGRYYGFGTSGFSFDSTTVNDYGITYTQPGLDFNTVLAGYSNIKFATNQTERMRITSTGLLQFNSGYGSVATAYGCRAWVNFNGTGTVAIRGSGNVTSITDNGVGSYTVNFTTAMPDVNYGIANGNGDISWGAVARFSSISTNNFLVETTGNSTTGNGDCALVCVSIFR